MCYLIGLSNHHPVPCKSSALRHLASRLIVVINTDAILFQKEFVKVESLAQDGKLQQKIQPKCRVDKQNHR